MTLCVKTNGHCLCQPDEGVFCPDYKPDAYVQCLMDTITALLRPSPSAAEYDPASGKCRGDCDCSIGQTCRAYLAYKAKNSSPPGPSWRSIENEITPGMTHLSKAVAAAGTKHWFSTIYNGEFYGYEVTVPPFTPPPATTGGNK